LIIEATLSLPVDGRSNYFFKPWNLPAQERRLGIVQHEFFGLKLENLQMSYIRFFAMIITSTVIMLALMYRKRCCDRT